MIEKIKKITLLVSKKEREKFLLKLRNVGVLHIKETKEPIHSDITLIDEKISKINKLIEIIKPYKIKANSSKEVLTEENILEKCKTIELLEKEKGEKRLFIKNLEQQKEWFNIWTDFNPKDIIFLKNKGIYIQFFTITKQEFEEIKDKNNIFLIKKNKNNVNIIVVSLKEKIELQFNEIIIPLESRHYINKKIDNLKKEIENIENIFKTTASKLTEIQKIKQKIEQKREFITVKYTMQEETEFCYMQGFCPKKKINNLISILKLNGVGYIIEDPNENDDPPTLITKPKYLKIIDPVFKFMNTIPGYKEFDISFSFLMFFGLFFAMIIGDAGYGVLFFLISLIMHLKLKNKIMKKEPFFLIYFLSINTIIWGCITGTWFGSEYLSQQPILKNFIIKSIGSFSIGNENILIFICFIIGAIQLTIAHLLRALRFINSLKCLSEIGWIFILWGMFFTAGKFVIGRDLPIITMWLFVIGVNFVLIFSNLQKGIIKGILSTLTDLPLSIISSFSDIVSYLRLFAVGYSSVVIASSFNDMALSNGINGFITGIIAAFILFIGHILNISLGFMGVIVHGIRLNMLEYSGHLGMQWSGKEYKAFCEKE